MRLWRLDRIISVDLLDLGCQRRKNFNFYATLSFGAFQEELVDVVLRFVPKAEDDAEQLEFHPTENRERPIDGWLTIGLRVGGIQEICSHLFTWGTAVTVVEPDELRHYLVELAEGLIHG